MIPTVIVLVHNGHVEAVHSDKDVNLIVVDGETGFSDQIEKVEVRSIHSLLNETLENIKSLGFLK